MKQVIIALTICIAAYACGNQDASKKEESTSTTTTTEASGSSEDSTKKANEAAAKLSSNPVYTKGLELVAGADCLTCHKVDEKNIGPAYRDVANKYENTAANVSMLADKIIKGGQGVWGSIPMTAHADLSKADAEAMVKYVFLLKK